METSILSAYSKNECQKYFDYLERLRQICTEPYHTCRKNFRSCDIRRNGQEKFCWRGSAHFERRRRIQNAEALPDGSGCSFLSVGAGAESET